MIQNPHGDPDQHQNVTTSRGPTPAHAYHVWSTSISAFVSSVCLSVICEQNDRQTDRQTDRTNDSITPPALAVVTNKIDKHNILLAVTVASYYCDCFQHWYGSRPNDIRSKRRSTRIRREHRVFTQEKRRAVVLLEYQLRQFLTLCSDVPLDNTQQKHF